LLNFKKQHLILATFCINDVSFIGYRSTKFQSNSSAQTTVTAVFVKSPHFSFLCLRMTSDTKTWNWSVLEVTWQKLLRLSFAFAELSEIWYFECQ